MVKEIFLTLKKGSRYKSFFVCAIACIAILGYEEKNQPQLKHIQLLKNETPCLDYG